MTDDTRTPTTQAVPTETVRLMEAWATVAGPDHVWAGNEPHPWIEDIEGGCAVQGCVVDRVDHYVPPGLHLSCLGCGAAGLEGPTYCATHGDWLCERCITAIRSGGAEARDATGLRLDADLTERLSDHFGHAHSTYACNCGDRFRAALATTPPEPRWPSRDELAKALEAVTRGTWSTPARRSPEAQQRQDEKWLLDTADAILAALREGGERPMSDMLSPADVTTRRLTLRRTRP